MQPGGAIRNLLTCQKRQGRSADPFLLTNGIFEKFHDSYYGEIFGKDAPRYFIQQYAEDKDGTPFWKLGKSVGVRYSDGSIGVARENPAAAGIKWQ